MVMRASVHSAKYINREGKSILVHCSDGWDRTPQVTALTQMLCDGEARTIRGLEVLIEKEWIALGHQFKERTMNFYGERPEHDPEQYSPVFLQFIECIWQVLIQFPDAFEFNQLFLLEILDHVTNGRSGTFLLSFDTTRDETKLRQNSLSVWTILNQNLERYCNPWYNPELRFNCEPLMPNYHVGKLQLWEAYYCRGDQVCARSDYLERSTHTILQLKEENAQLREELERMKMSGERQWQTIS